MNTINSFSYELVSTVKYSDLATKENFSQLLNNTYDNISNSLGNMNLYKKTEILCDFLVNNGFKINAKLTDFVKISYDCSIGLSLKGVLLLQSLEVSTQQDISFILFSEIIPIDFYKTKREYPAVYQIKNIQLVSFLFNSFIYGLKSEYENSLSIIDYREEIGLFIKRRNISEE